MSIGRTVYRTLFQRTSTFTMTIIVAAFAFERGFESGVDYIWRTHNKGKLWEDIKDKYEQPS